MPKLLFQLFHATSLSAGFEPAPRQSRKRFGRELPELVFACAFVSCLTSVAQPFNSVSDGSYGPLNITTNTTLDLPPNGIFNCTTIVVSNGVTLSFNRNPLNTPVYLLATGNVNVSGTISVAGSNGNAVSAGIGGPGGFDGGNPGQGLNQPGAGLGPGGGAPGAAGNGVNSGGPGSYGSLSGLGSTNKGSTYGSPLLVPLIGGSGGGGQTADQGGGGGGGAILIASNTRIDLSGTINASSGLSDYNDGSGGAIRLVAPVVAGTGTLNVSGRWGGNGRIRFDALDRSSANFVYTAGPSTVSSGALMLVFPNPLPRLDIVEAAGTQIAVGATTPVVVQLPFGSSSNRTVTVRAQDFKATVPVAVVLTPEQGSSILYTNTIDNLSANPATNVFNVVLPVNVVVKVNAWTR
jgi:hypothetical protein